MKSFHQHRFSIVGVADNQQIRHAVRFRIRQQIFKFGQYFLGLRITDPTRRTDALNACMIGKRQQFCRLRRKMARHGCHDRSSSSSNGFKSGSFGATDGVSTGAAFLPEDLIAPIPDVRLCSARLAALVLPCASVSTARIRS